MYELMNKDKVVATFEERYEYDDYTYELVGTRTRALAIRHGSWTWQTRSNAT